MKPKIFGEYKKDLKNTVWKKFIFIIALGVLSGSDILDIGKINQRYYTSYLDSSFVGKSDDETIQIFNNYADGLTVQEYLTLMYEVAERGDLKSASMTLIRQLNKKYHDDILDPLILLELINNESLNSDFRYVLLDFLGKISKHERTTVDQIANTLLAIAINVYENEMIRMNALSVLRTENLSSIIRDNSHSQELLFSIATNPNNPENLSSRATKFLDFVNPNKLDSYSIKILDNYMEYSEPEIKNAIEHFRFRDELITYLDVIKFLGDGDHDKHSRFFCITILSDVGSLESVAHMLMMDRSEIPSEYFRSQLLMNWDIVQLMIDENQSEDVISYGIEALKILRLVESVELLSQLNQTSQNKLIKNHCETAINELNTGRPLVSYSTISNLKKLERRTK